MTVGTLLIGVSGYLFLALVGHGRFDPDAAAALASTYLLSNILGPGLFVAIEQQTSRLVSARLAVGAPARTAARRTAVVAAGIAGTVLLAVLFAAVPVRDLVLGGQIGLLIGLAVSVVGSAAVFWIRGVAGGRRDLRGYGLTLVVDAGVRIVGCAVLAIADVRTPAAYGLALCVGPLVAFVCTVGRGEPPAADSRLRSADHALVPNQPTDPGPPAWPALLAAVTSLLVSSGLAMTMANLSPVLVTAALPADPALAFAFATALVLTRVPLLLTGPVQAVVLPKLSAAVTLGRMAEFNRQLGRGLVLVSALTGAGVAGALLIGRWIVRVVFGSAADLVSAGTLALLALAAGLLMAIALLQPALVALGRNMAMLLGWAGGAAAFAAAFLLPLAPLDRALVAQLAGPAVTVTVHLFAVRRPGAVVPVYRSPA